MAKKADAKREMAKRKTKTGASNRGHKKGQGALKAGSAFTHSNASSKAGRTAPNGDTRVREKGAHFRSEGTIKRLGMYKKKPDKHKMKEQPTGPARIQPDRRWFGNTRVISQDKMQAFRETVAKGVQDPFSVVLKSSKLPMSLLRETEGKASRMDLLSIQPYQDVFSKRKQQKRVKLNSYDLENLVASAETRAEGYNSKNDKKLKVDPLTGHELEAPGEAAVLEKHRGEEIFNKGTSRRIWAELYKVVDASDIIVFVLDARDPMGTRCLQLEREIRKTRAHKHVVLVLNKVDLVPTWVTRRWVSILMKDFPTLAFHASITNPFGKNALLNLLRQFSTLMKDKKHVTVGMIGYPNVGKSSVINTLKRKKVCKAAPVPGETRVWQYIALTKRLYLLDCPGIVPATLSDFQSDCAKVLKGVVRAERIESPSDYIDEVLSKVKKQYLLQRYKLPTDTEWADGEAFLTILANKMGKLFKGGDPDLDTTARVVLYDWQRGRIPYFTLPPEDGSAAASSSPDVAAKPNEAPAADAATPALTDGVAPASSEAAPGPPEATAGSGEGAPTDQGAAGSSADKPNAEADSDGAEDSEEEEGEEDDDLAAGKAEASVRQNPRGGVRVNVQQSFSSLACSLAYDEDDRQGEALPPAEPEGGEGKPGPAGKKGGKKAGKKQDKKRKAPGGGRDQDAAGRGKKKARRGGGGRGNAGAQQGDGPVVRPGSMDWNAVVAEFGM